MLEKLLNSQEVHVLNKQEQRSVKAGSNTNCVKWPGTFLCVTHV